MAAGELERTYVGAWQKLSESLANEGAPLTEKRGANLFDYAEPPQIPTKGNRDTYVGAERVALEGYFKQLVTAVKQGVRQARAIGDPLKRHNEFTAYTWLYLSMATGSRGVHHPFEHLDIAVAIGSIHIHEKDYESGGQARVAFLPEGLIRHLEQYLEWCRGMLEVMARAAPASGVPFGEMRVQSKRQTLQSTESPTTYPALGSLFFLDEQWCPKPATPTAVKEHLGKRHPLPINAQRHVLRRNLMTRECPEALIDAFMGHWDRGREPWARYSTVEPQIYRDEILGHLDPLLERLGFEPLEP